MRKAKGLRVSCHKMGKVWQGEAPEAKAEAHGMGGDLKTLYRKDSFLCFPGFALSVGKLVRRETSQKRFLYAVYEERPAGISLRFEKGRGKDPFLLLQECMPGVANPGIHGRIPTYTP